VIILDILRKLKGATHQMTAMLPPMTNVFTAPHVLAEEERRTVAGRRSGTAAWLHT